MFLLQGLKACNARWLFLGMADITIGLEYGIDFFYVFAFYHGIVP